MGELHTSPKHPMCVTDSESYFDLHVVPMDTKQMERLSTGIWRSITRLTLGGGSR